MNKSITKEWAEKKEFDVKAIIEDSITNLMLQGLKRESALSLLVIQSIIRIRDPAELRRLIKFIEERLDDDDDDDDEDA
jgi:hypothetical protein